MIINMNESRDSRDNIDSLKEKTKISISELSTSLLIMELKEIIKKTDTDTYTLILN